MLTAYKVNPSGCDDTSDKPGINLVDLTPGTPAPPPVVKIAATVSVTPNTVNEVSYLTKDPVIVTLTPGVAVGDQILVLIRNIGGKLTIKDGPTGPTLLEKDPPLNEDIVQTYRWSGTNWLSAN